MKGLILCGGNGKRLLPITLNRPKQLIRVAGKPLLFYILNNLKNSGIKEIGIVIGKNGSKIVKLFGNGQFMGLNLTYIYQKEQKGTAHAVNISRDFLGKDKFILCLGSDIFENNFKKHVQFFENANVDGLILLYPHKDVSLHGMAVVKNGELVKVVEKPKKPISKWVITGAYLFGKSIFKIIDKIKPSQLETNRGEYVITDAIQAMIDHKLNVVPQFLSGWWETTRNPSSKRFFR